MPPSESILLPPAHKTNRQGSKQSGRVRGCEAELTARAKPGCNHDTTGEYDCRKQPCILCMGPWNRNK